MSRRVWTLRGIAIALARVVMVLACIAFFAWLFVNGGVPRFGPSATASAVEDCGQRIVGPRFAAARLMPELAADFLRRNGYSVASHISDGTHRIVGERNGRRCTLVAETAAASESFRALASHEAVLVVAARPINASETASLRRGGGGDLDGERARIEHVMALDAVAVVVNGANRVEKLSLAQAKEIFLGETEDWRSLGAAQGPVRLHVQRNASDAEPFFVDAVLGGDPDWGSARRRAQAHVNEAELIAGVARDPNGVAFVSAAFLQGAQGVRPLALSHGGFAFPPTSENVRAELYPLPRRLFLYARANEVRDNPLVRGFIRYVKSTPAFDIVDRAGYVSLRSATPTTADANGFSCLAGAPETFAYRAAVRGAQRLPVLLRFLSDTSELDSLARDDVARHASLLREQIQNGVQVKLIGHSDTEGAARDNRMLGLERAEAVRQAFEAAGVFGLQIESAGEACPLAENLSESGRRLNRRVEIWIAASRPPTQGVAREGR